jgi:hypothetical protein
MKILTTFYISVAMVQTIRTPKALFKEVTSIHLPIVQDAQFIGTNVYSIVDLNLLIEWWNNGEELELNQGTLTKYRAKLMELHAAVWIRINQLHPNQFLRFDDIRK